MRISEESEKILSAEGMAIATTNGHNVDGSAAVDRPQAAAVADPDPDIISKQNSITRTIYRDIYPAIDPTRPELSQEGRVVFITGVSRGLGKIVSSVSSSSPLGRLWMAAGVPLCARLENND